MTGAGALGVRIALARRVAVDDGMGNETGQWSEEMELLGERIPLKGGEEVMAARLASRQPFILRLRQSSRSRLVTPGWRARDVRTGALYNIRSIVDPDGRRQWFDMLVEEGVAEG